MVKPAEWVVQAEALEGDSSLIRFLRRQLPELSGNAVRQLVETGKVFVNDLIWVHPTRELQPGQTVSLRPAAPRADRIHLRGPTLYHLDSQLVVAEKPIGILTIPFEDDHDSLMDRVRKVIPKVEKKGPGHPLRAVHRLDKESSGLVVFARNIPTQRALQDQFAAHTVERAYVALVHGEVSFERQATVRSVLVTDRGDGLKGSARDEERQGKEAVTHLEVLERLPGATLLRCELETGRTHQIRIHVAELGHPILGEPVYVRDFRGKLIKSPRLMLHAVTLGFVHPSSGQRLRFESPVPEVLEALLKGLRRGRVRGQPGLEEPSSTGRR